MNERRKEFTKKRNRILKENGWTSLICARCGRESQSTHLHHIVAVADGGSDDPENLIPLCCDCHNEWDTYEEMGVEFGPFLTTLPLHCFASMYYLGIFRLSEKVDLNMLYVVQFAGRAFKRKDEAHLYWEDMKAQNKVFSKYPYGDAAKMLELYGKHYEPATKEEIKAVLDEVVSHLPD